MNKARLKALLAQYGRIALSTYLGVFVLVLAGFAAVFSFGLEAALGVDLPEIARGAGVLGAAYAATKLTQPLRILATIALTPLVAGVLQRRAGPKGAD